VVAEKPTMAPTQASSGDGDGAPIAPIVAAVVGIVALAVALVMWKRRVGGDSAEVGRERAKSQANVDAQFGTDVEMHTDTV
jgi:hypothetical protein